MYLLDRNPCWTKIIFSPNLSYFPVTYVESMTNMSPPQYAGSCYTAKVLMLFTVFQVPLFNVTCVLSVPWLMDVFLMMFILQSQVELTLLYGRISQRTRTYSSPMTVSPSLPLYLQGNNYILFLVLVGFRNTILFLVLVGFRKRFEHDLYAELFSSNLNYDLLV